MILWYCDATSSVSHTEQAELNAVSNPAVARQIFEPAQCGLQSE